MTLFSRLEVDLSLRWDEHGSEGAIRSQDNGSNADIYISFKGTFEGCVMTFEGDAFG